MSILLVSDIHATERPPSSCTVTYWDDLHDLLVQTVMVARERRVSAVVWAGDVFHHKAPSRTSHRLVQDLIRVIEGYPCPVYIVPGNHDVQHDHLGSIASTQPLGVLYHAGAIMLEEWAGSHAGDDYPLYGVPWQGEWTEETVYNALGHYRDRVFKTGTGIRFPLVVAHAPLYPPGRELKWENYPAVQWAHHMGNEGFCFYGHVHEPHGVWECDNVTFCNNGALSRGSLHEYNLDRAVGCTLFNSVQGGFEFIPLKARPASEVFRLREKEQAADVAAKLDNFLATIGSTTLEVLNVETVMAAVRAQGLGTELENLVEELLAQGGSK